MERAYIDPGRLAELAGDPKIKSGKIPALFGRTHTSFFHLLINNPTLREIYEKARHDAGFRVGARVFTKHTDLDSDDFKILEAIAQGRRTVAEIAKFAEFELHSFASRLYNLEHERHEIWSTAIGRPSVTTYFLRHEELNAEGSVKGVAA